MTDTPDRLIVGTRGSLLARAQTGWVVKRIRDANPGLQVDVEIISTRGDREQNKPLPEIGGKGLFTEDLERALHKGRIDVAVHSAKDLPTDLTEGLAILCVPTREDPRDAWIAGDGQPFVDIKPGSRVGTTSLRRQAQLRMIVPDLEFVQLRGNVDTRIRKIQEGQCEGAVLAMAGLKRVGMAEHVTHPFESAVMVPAPGQGALAIEGREGDSRVASLLAGVHDEATALELAMERRILTALDAGCHAPVGIHARVDGERLSCEVLVSEPGGRRSLRHRVVGRADDNHEAMADGMIASLRAGGAEAIIAASRQEYQAGEGEQT